MCIGRYVKSLTQKPFHPMSIPLTLALELLFIDHLTLYIDSEARY